LEFLENNLGAWVIRARWWIVLATLLAVAAASSGIARLEFQADYRIYFGEHNPELQAFEAVEDTYTRSDNLLFILAPRDGRVFTRESLTVVKALTESAWQLPFATRVDSVTNFQHTEASDDELIVRDLVADPGSLRADELAHTRKIALAEPLLRNRLISPQGNVTTIYVRATLPGVNPSRELPQVAEAAETLAAEYRQRHPEMDFYLTGQVMLDNAFPEASKADLHTLFPLSLISIFTLLALLLGGLRMTLATLLIVILSISAALGLAGYMGFEVSPPMALAPVVILTMAIANCVHLLLSFIYHLKRGSDRHGAVEESLRINLQPVCLAGVTTALGFLTMNFSDVPPLQDMGTVVAIGVLIALLLSITLLPAVLSLINPRVSQVENGRETWMMRFGGFVVRRRKLLLPGMGVLIAVFVAFIPRNELNDVFLNYFDQSFAVRRASDFATENLIGFYSINYSLESGRSGGVSEPAFLAQVEAFANWLRRQALVVHVNSVTDTIKRLNKNLHADAEAWYRLPDSRELTAQYLLLYEMSLPYGLDLNDQIDIDKSATKVTVSTEPISSNEILALNALAEDWLRENAPDIKSGIGTGTSIMFSHIGRRNIISMLVGSSLALVLISFLLMFAFRSVAIGLICLVPNLVPAAMGFGLWGIIRGEVGLGLSAVIGMTLGIVIDDTVHFMSKYVRARRELGLTGPDAVIYAFSIVGRALVVTSVVLILGFSVLAFSGFQINAEMGLMTAIVIAFALVADFLFLPPLIIRFESLNENTRTARSTAADSTSA